MQKTNNCFISNKYSIYILYGEEEALRIEYIDKFRKEALLNNYLNREIFIVDSINFNWDKVSFTQKEQGLFCEKNFIEINVLNGKIGANGSKFILNLVKAKLIDTLVLIVFPKLNKLQLQSKWFTSLSSVAYIVEAKKVNFEQLPFWIKNRLQTYNLTIDKDALDLFINKVEGNLLFAKQEMEKLYLNLDNKSNITFTDIDTNVSDNARYDIFQLSLAWMKGDLKRITNIIDSWKLSLQEPILVLWVISEDIRTLLKLKRELFLGNSIASVKNKLRLWSDKQKFALIACKRISNKMLLHSLQECAKIDKVLKGVDNFSQDVWILFKKLLIDLAIAT